MRGLISSLLSNPISVGPKRGEVPYKVDADVNSHNVILTRWGAQIGPKLINARWVIVIGPRPRPS